MCFPTYKSLDFPTLGDYPVINCSQMRKDAEQYLGAQQNLQRIGIITNIPQ